MGFVFMLVYQPDSIAPDGRAALAEKAENQLLFEMARYNFTNFLVRNFDMQIDGDADTHRMLISGFLNYDEVLQYARQLRADASGELSRLLRRCATVIISEPNLPLVGTRFTYDEYQQFYEKTFLPLTITDEQLLLMPESVEQPATSDDSPQDADDEPADNGGGLDFDDDFF